jgi:hypothetical protein
MNLDKLDNKNFVLYCARHYGNPNCASMEEFYSDLRRIKYVKKLVTRYIQTGDLKERLILNHLIILNNVFGPELLVKMIFLKMRTQLRYIKPFLIMLNILPDVVYNVGNEARIITDDIPMDQKTVEALRQI